MSSPDGGQPGIDWREIDAAAGRVGKAIRASLDELARRRCQREGHEFDVITATTMADPAGQPVAVRCTRCRAEWSVRSPAPEEANHADRDA